MEGFWKEGKGAMKAQRPCGHGSISLTCSEAL